MLSLRGAMPMLSQREAMPLVPLRERTMPWFHTMVQALQLLHGYNQHIYPWVFYVLHTPVWPSSLHSASQRRGCLAAWVHGWTAQCHFAYMCTSTKLFAASSFVCSLLGPFVLLCTSTLKSGYLFALFCVTFAGHRAQVASDVPFCTLVFLLAKLQFEEAISTMTCRAASNLF